MSKDVPHVANGNASASREANASLPDDPALLKQMIQELLATLRDRDRQCEQLRHRIDQLLRRLYGPRSEKFDPNQPWLFPEMQAAAQGEAAGAQTPATSSASEPEAASATRPPKKANGHGRRGFPASLPRVRQTHDLTEAERCCPDCGQARVKIGEEISEQVDYEPASLFVIEHVRCKYVCEKCHGHVTTADKPAQPIDKGLPGPGLLAHIVTCKYHDSIPLHRQESILARHGLEISRSTSCGWMAACAELLEPLYDAMVADVLLSRVVHTDDTTLPVLDKTRDVTRKARLWVYVGDRDHPHNVFDYTPNHQRDGPAKFLATYKGYLQADAFSGYDGIYLASKGAIVEAACNAHARRKFYDAQSSDASRSHAALAWYRRLYEVEHQIKDELARRGRERVKEGAAPLSGEEAETLTLTWRQEKSKPVLTALCQWLEGERPNVLPKSPMGQAISYTLGNWEALARYAESGILAIDNNIAEREMKRIAIGRKNYLFAGSDQGGKTAAILSSFTSTCRRHGIDPFAYLRDVLPRLSADNLPPEALANLLPNRWAATQTPPHPKR